MKKIILPLIILGSLTACGGGSESSQNIADNKDTSVPPTSSTTVEYRVIDGYIEKADVCVIRVNQASCESIGSTNSDGVISIPDDVISGRLVATIIGGQSKDADIVGYVAHTYQMIAEISADTANVITPFTTLDILDDEKSLDDIAADLNLPIDVISSDYIASQAAEQSHVHALARAMTMHLKDDVSANNIDSLHAATNSINAYIEGNVTNAGIDPNTVNVQTNNDKLSHTLKISSLETFLEQGPLSMVSMNTPYFYREGIREVLFSQGVVKLDSSTSNYEINEDDLILTSNGEQSTDKFLYVSSRLSLSVPVADKDLIIMSSTVLGNGHAVRYAEQVTWDRSTFAGQTRFLIFDDAMISDQEPRPSFVKMEFSAETVTLHENGEVMTIPWAVDSFAGVLKLDMNATNDGVIRLTEMLSDEHITIAKGAGAPSLVLKDEALATSIYEKWKTLN
jgi:hypothetical protein